MAKFYGMIGFAEMQEIEPSIFVESITEKPYYGELLRVSRQLENPANGSNKGIRLNNDISILSDPYADYNMTSMRYVVFNGVKWEVTDVEVMYPRLKLIVGGMYHD